MGKELLTDGDRKWIKLIGTWKMKLTIGIIFILTGFLALLKKDFMFTGFYCFIGILTIGGSLSDKKSSKIFDKLMQ